MTDTWHAVMTKAGCEAKADLEIRRLGFMTFYPFEKVRQKRKIPNRNAHQIVDVERPLYPRYLFALVRDGQSVRPINDAAPVSCIVSTKGAPLRIPDATITLLMDRCGEDGLYRHRDAVARERLAVGVPVRFLEGGPFYGLVATVAADLGKSIRVTMQMFGVPMKVTTTLENLRILQQAS